MRILILVCFLCFVELGAVSGESQSRDETSAPLQLAPLFGDHAVLQREKPLRIFGIAHAGEEVTVTLGDQAGSATADEEGRWLVELPAMQAGGPHTLTATVGGTSVTSEDILIGEVWLCTGQSNMYWPLEKTGTGEQAIAASQNDQLRLLSVGLQYEAEPQETFTTKGWEISRPESARSFSAVGWFFGRRLHAELGVPVGLIAASVGGTRIETWMPREAVLAAEAELGKKLVAAVPGKPENAQRNALSVLYHGMIHPLRLFPSRGWLWYQGEGNAFQANDYKVLLPKMIASWREAWADRQMPFYIVQLTGFEVKRPEADGHTPPAWAEMRETQQQIADEVPRSGIVIITDLGDESDIHPAHKEQVGERLAALAVADIYGRDDLRPRYPELANPRFKQGHAILQVKGGEKIEMRGDSLRGFALRDTAGHWHDAQAAIQDGEIIVSSPSVPEPDAVRYNWKNYTDGNLFDVSGLPVKPFRSDSEAYRAEEK